MSHTRKPLALLVGAAVAAVAAGSLFSMDAMAHGYMQDKAAAAKAGEGKCGEGKCGGKAKDAHEGGCGMAKMDTDKDGRLSRAEFDAAHKGKEDKFASHDHDGDGFISQAEMDKHHADMKAKGDGKTATEGKCGEGKCGEGKCGGSP
ncbi:hypothetical protein [Thermomonas carbonis]|uniref:EF-hand domain-containing protein n=1 Tax=Thermomonas carbonis TaxID=1463158 RepID=A0A7G9SQC6_9GAMM|nr:hypothetical protein [Thermomonas carbonis]QNN70051.1 hypothetical protein H9L16_15775 [Thermomonas carbonis]GHB97388.1 hypothetical protein GCM10010080_06880 [Thermomonas carbonis]